MKILYFTFDFAPQGSSSSIRSVNLVKHLVQQGHSVKVITYDEPSLCIFSPPDAGLVNKVPSEVEIIRVPSGPLRQILVKKVNRKGKKKALYKKSLIGNPLTQLLIPDPHIESVPRFVCEGFSQLNSFSPDVLFTQGYPYSMHLVGTWLKQKFKNVLWVADYGDPWSGNPVSELSKPMWRDWLEYKIERLVLRLVDLVTVTTEKTKELYLQLFPFIAPKIMVLPMGFDPEDFEFIQPKTRKEEEQEQVWFVHTGRIYSEARDIRPFINALSTMMHQDPIINSRFRVYLVGEVEESLRAKIQNSPAKDLFVFVSWVPLYESIAYMKAADYLLLFGNKGGVQIPGKVYQYLGSGRPILMIKSMEGDQTAEIALGSLGSIVVSNDENSILDFLKIVLKRPRLASDIIMSRVNSSYSWFQIAHKFTNMIEKINFIRMGNTGMGENE